MRVIVLLLVPLVRAAIDPSICAPATPGTNQPKRPQIPNAFDAHVDCVIVNKNETTMVHEWYDFPHNRGVAVQHGYGKEFKAYYDYNVNEFIGMFPQTGQCTVSKLSTSNQRFLFGNTITSGGQDKIYTPSGALHFGSGVPEQYLGDIQVRGVLTQAWRSCQYWDEMKATMNVTWYFSDPNSWDTALLESQVPVRCHVLGKVQETAAKSHMFEHYYEFIHFRNFIEDATVFEMNDGIVCPGRINSKPLPNVPNTLSMIVETIDEVQKKYTYTAEYFDSRLGLTRFDMRPTDQSAFGSNIQRIVRDFNTGVQYIKDKTLGNCTVQPAADAGWDDRMKDPQHIRMDTAREFFHFDSNYTYTGVKTIRGVACDTWISLRTDFPPGLGMNSTWEWAFVTANWSSGYDAVAVSQDPIPYQLHVKLDAMGIDQTSNLFQFNAEEPNTDLFDVTNCMATEWRRTFRLSFSRQYTFAISQHQANFRYAALLAVMQSASVSPIRIANIRVNVYNKTAHLTFDLTDLPPVKGDVTNPTVGLTLDVAANTFMKSVEAGSFQIVLNSNGRQLYIKPVISSLVEMTASQNQLDTSICTPPPTPAPGARIPMKPHIPASFEVHVDCVIVNKNQTTMVHEHYDDPNDRAVVIQHDNDQMYKAYFDYQHNELVELLPDTGKCKVSQLSFSDQRFLFGYVSQGGKGHIYTPSGALHFGGNETEQYLGLVQVRGIWCQTWRSCQYWGSMRASMNVTWYFSDPNSWDTALQISEVPVRCHVIGKVRDTPTASHDFEHFYEFIHFRNFIEEPSVFEMDSGIVCPGRINTKPLPNISDVLAMVVEQVDEVQKTFSVTSEWFDSRMGLTRFDMQPSYLSASKYGTNRLAIVRDFNTGIQYVKDHEHGNCTVTALSDDTWDDKMQDPQHIRIVTAQEFFHFDSNYTYTGIKTIRDMQCDTWVSRRSDLPIAGLNSTWEWAFLSANDTSGYDKLPYAESAIPVQLRIKVDAVGMDTRMNIYQFNAQEPSVVDFDITNCMTTERRRSFRIDYPKNYTTMIQMNMPTIKYATVNGIIGAASVSPLRIANLMIDTDKQGAHLSFDLTDVPPVTGDVLDDNIGLPLDIVASTFLQSVDQGQFLVNFMLDGNDYTIKPLPMSLVETTLIINATVAAQTTNTPAPNTQKPQTQPPNHTQPPKHTQSPGHTQPPKHTQPTQKVVTQGPPATPRHRTAYPRPTPTPFNPYQFVSSLNQLCGANSGYSAGVMAGVAVVMVIFGGVGGGGLAIFLSRSRRI